MFSPNKTCASTAGPFRNIHDDNVSSYLLLLFFISSALITTGVRFLVLGYCFSPLPSPNPNQPTTKRCLNCQHTDALPPPYSESESKSAREAILAEAKSRKARRPSVARFVICTILSIINILAIVLEAFSIQGVIFCGMQSPSSKPPDFSRYVGNAVLVWTFFFFISATWASTGILCWAMWLRNLWGGPEAAERWPIQHDFPLIILAGGLFGPPTLVILLVFLVLVTLVVLVGFVVKEIGKRMWGCLCKKPLKEEEAIEVERGIGCASSNVT